MKKDCHKLKHIRELLTDGSTEEYQMHVLTPMGTYKRVKIYVTKYEHKYEYSIISIAEIRD